MSKVDQQGQAEDVQFWNAKKCYTETGCSTEFLCIYKQLFKGLGKVKVSRAHQGCSKWSYLSVSAIIETLLVTRCYSKQHASKSFKDLKGLHYSLQTSQKDLTTHSSSIFQTFSQVD